MVNVEPDVAERLRRQSLIAYDEVACRAEGREPPTVRIARFTTASVRCAQDQTTHRPGAVAQCVKCMQPAMMNHVGIGGSGAGDDVRDDHVHTLETLGDGAGSVDFINLFCHGFWRRHSRWGPHEHIFRGFAATSVEKTDDDIGNNLPRVIFYREWV
ncbi:unnamed protein product (mitochondrion) [Plasmodiophora brassicae]|uniref:Uncharacterized protein n=1 Tax=Plasmodiophora brassicae TaxID=37360 RepID=A0A3P3Y044_PLABS|nr:unnamed protein product [Plasmodiophora brassicae]